MGLVRTVAPAAQPLELAELAAYLKIPEEQLGSTATQAYLTGLLNSAVERCERVADRSLITQTWRLTLDDWCDKHNGAYLDQRFGVTIQLGRGPVQSVSSIAYTDTAGASQTLSASGYTADVTSDPARVVAAYGQSWPTVRQQPGAVTVTFVAGYGASGASVPDEIKQRLRAYCAYCHENRGDRAAAVIKDPIDEEFLDKLFLRFWTGRL